VPRLLVHEGRLTSSARLRWVKLLWVALGVGWLWAFLALPLLAVVGLSFTENGEYGQMTTTPTLENYRRVAGFGLLGWTSANAWTLLRSVVVAGATTLIAVALAYPTAFAIAALPTRRRTLALAAITIPFATNLVVRTYGWMLLLAADAPPARALHTLGLLDHGEALHPGALAVYLGMASACLPFAVLPLYASVERLDWTLVEAARDAYAGRWRTFRHAILPQTAPGLWAALVLTFVPALGMFLVPDLLGGGRHQLLGNLIQRQFAGDWPFGAALAVVLIVASLGGLWALRRRGDAHA